MKVKKKSFSQDAVLYHPLRREFRKPKHDKDPKINLEHIVKKIRGTKKVLYKLDVPLVDEEEEEKEDPEKKAKREAFLRKRKQFYTDYRNVQLARELIKQEECEFNSEPNIDIEKMQEN